MSPMLRTRTVAVALAVALAAGGCSFDELLDWMDDTGGTDLSRSRDAGEQGAGRAGTETDKEKQARDKITEAIDEKDVEKVREARRLRPEDPKYAAYLAAFQIAAGEPWKEAVTSTINLMCRAIGFPDHASANDVRRRVSEETLDAVHDLLIAYPEGSPERNRLLSHYCPGLDSYQSTYSGPEVDLYMSISADYGVCP